MPGAKGYFNLADIEFAVLETNGRLSILPRSDKRPLTPEDMNLHPPEEGLCANVIIDGVVMERHLKSIGKKPGMARPPDERAKNQKCQGRPACHLRHKRQLQCLPL